MFPTLGQLLSLTAPIPNTTIQFKIGFEKFEVPMFAETHLQQEREISSLLKRLPSEKLVVVYDFVSFLVSRESDQMIMEQEAEVVRLEDSLQVGSRNDTEYLLSSPAMRERLLAETKPSELIPFEAVREKLGI